MFDSGIATASYDSQHLNIIFGLSNGIFAQFWLIL